MMNNSNFIVQRLFIIPSNKPFYIFNNYLYPSFTLFIYTGSFFWVFFCMDHRKQNKRKKQKTQFFLKDPLKKLNEKAE